MSHELTTYRIRPATAADHADVHALLAASDLPVEGIDPGLRGFRVAVEDGRVIAVAGLEVYGRFGLLRSVAVAAEARGRGLGAELTRAALEDARAQGLEAVYALTTTAQGYFPRLGFRVTGREDVPEAVEEAEEFRSICPSSAVVLVRETD